MTDHQKIFVGDIEIAVSPYIAEAVKKMFEAGCDLADIHRLALDLARVARLYRETPPW